MHPQLCSQFQGHRIPLTDMVLIVSAMDLHQLNFVKKLFGTVTFERLLKYKNSTGK